MSLNLFETIRCIVQEELRQVRTVEIGLVQAQQPHAADSDDDNYSCDVQLRNSGLVLKNVPVATGRIGGVSIPDVGALVLVQFVGGDINAPVITGSLYNAEDRPPKNDDGQLVLHLPLGADDDSAVHLELHSSDARTLHLKLGKALDIELKDDDPVVKLDVDGGKATLQIDRDGAVTLSSNGDIKINGNNINVEAQAQLTLKGSTVNIN